MVLPGPGPTRGAGPARPGLDGRGPEAPGRSGGRVSSTLGARGSQISSLHPPGEVGPSALGCNAAKTKLKAEPPSPDRWGEGAPGSRGGRAGEPGYLVPLSSLRGPGTRGAAERPLIPQAPALAESKPPSSPTLDSPRREIPAVGVAPLRPAAGRGARGWERSWRPRRANFWFRFESREPRT